MCRYVARPKSRVSAVRSRPLAYSKNSPSVSTQSNSLLRLSKKPSRDATLETITFRTYLLQIWRAAVLMYVSRSVGPLCDRNFPIFKIKNAAVRRQLLTLGAHLSHSFELLIRLGCVHRSIRPPARGNHEYVDWFRIPMELWIQHDGRLRQICTPN